MSTDKDIEVDLAEAKRIWADEVYGVEGSFFGLIDDQKRIIQFRYDEGIPNSVDDPRHLEIIRLDFPQPELKGSYAAQITIGAVEGLIERAFSHGNDHRLFEGLTFSLW